MCFESVCKYQHKSVTTQNPLSPSSSFTHTLGTYTPARAHTHTHTHVLALGSIDVKSVSFIVFVILVFNGGLVVVGTGKVVG